MEAAKRGFIVKYDPVDEARNTTGFTAVYLKKYIKTRGFVMRDSRWQELMGYCIEPTAEVLKRVFPNYHVTEFNNREFFASHDFEKTTPMKGLSIARMDKIPGIKETLEELEALPLFQELKRENPISKEDLERIRKHIMNEDCIGDDHPRNMLWVEPKKNQIEFEEKEILSILGITA